ncbi:hypothetical protein GCM10011360_06220 [Primorskyibacter flagellatus]|uniref:VPLPA-CTERM protein sorting domain-containing protein n=1 Tax=Primorskyibacter flagellatus TaxID=1387277 RepID=A0A916ZZV5_9RHOB|nr:hypothetical protein [Primorskyibacter flagellatus]GGE20287.1 hypothetical protein GCM10011360_06220 [Primorskyibacter flagellatus]
MFLNMNVRFLVLSASAMPAVALVPTTAEATSISLGISGGYAAFSEKYVGTEENPDAFEADLIGSAVIDDFYNGASESEPVNGEVRGSFIENNDLYFTNGAAYASADTAKGELKAGVSSTVDGKAVDVAGGYDSLSVNNGDEGAIGNGASAKLREVFTLTGSGTATFSALVDFDWEGDIYFNAYITGRNLSTGAFLSPEADQSINFFSEPIFSGIHSGSVVDRLISLSFDVDGALGDQYEITWNLGGFSYASDYCSIGDICGDGSSVQSSTFDAAHTANIFFSGSPGLNVVSNSSGFLAESEYQTYQPTDIGAVPLPATGVLLLAGVFGIGAAGRKRRAAA